jgi:hypothetical protein
MVSVLFLVMVTDGSAGEIPGVFSLCAHALVVAACQCVCIDGIVTNCRCVPDGAFWLALCIDLLHIAIFPQPLCCPLVARSTLVNSGGMAAIVKSSLGLAVTSPTCPPSGTAAFTVGAALGTSNTVGCPLLTSVAVTVTAVSGKLGLAGGRKQLHSQLQHQ